MANQKLVFQASFHYFQFHLCLIKAQYAMIKAMQLQQRHTAQYL